MKLSKINFKGIVELLEYTYKFFVGENKIYAEPLAKMLLIISIFLGISVYAVVDKYFRLSADARDTLVELSRVKEESNYLKREIKRLEITNERCTISNSRESPVARKEVVNLPKTNKPYEERDVVIDENRRALRPSRLVEIINN